MSREWIELEARAKINLSLCVNGRRADGYHELRSVFVPLDLCDRLRVQARTPPAVEVCCPERPDLDGRDNLVYRALARLREAVGSDAPGFHARLRKRIPVAAGLGGGSSDAAAALRAGQLLLPEPLPAPELAALALSLGADVPFFLQPGPAWVRGIGERIEPIDDLPDLPLVLVVPRVAVSTAEVFRAYDERPPKALTNHNTGGRKPRFSGAVARAARVVRNELEPVTARRVPEVARAVSDLRTAGALAAAMSGSGPATFGVFASAAGAEAAAKELSTARPDRLTQVVTGLGQQRQERTTGTGGGRAWK